MMNATPYVYTPYVRPEVHIPKPTDSDHLLATGCHSSTVLPSVMAPKIRSEQTAARYEPLRPLLQKWVSEKKTLRQMAALLEGLSISPPMGGDKWALSTVRRALSVLGIAARGRWG